MSKKQTHSPALHSPARKPPNPQRPRADGPRSKTQHLLVVLAAFWTMLLRTGHEPTSAEAEPAGLDGDPLQPGRPACSVRVTSEDGALCVINPLFLSVHSHEGWRDFGPTLCHSGSKRGTLKAWNGPGRSRTPDLAGAASSQEGRPTQESLEPPEFGPQEEAEEEGKGTGTGLGVAQGCTAAARSFGGCG